MDNSTIYFEEVEIHIEEINGHTEDATPLVELGSSTIQDSLEKGVNEKAPETSQEKFYNCCGIKFISLTRYYEHRKSDQCIAAGRPKKKRICQQCGQQFRNVNAFKKHRSICWRSRLSQNSSHPKSSCDLQVEENISKLDVEIEQAGDVIEQTKDKIAETDVDIEQADVAFEQTDVYVEQTDIDVEQTDIDVEQTDIDIEQAEVEIKNEKFLSKAEISKNNRPPVPTCSVCKIKFRSVDHYKMHVEKKNFLCRPKPFTCDKCGKIFNSLHHLLSHERRKTSCTKKILKLIISPEKQSVTPQGVKNKTVVQNTNNNIKSEAQQLICPTCGVKFNYPYLYKRHLSRTKPCQPLSNVSFSELNSHTTKNSKAKKPLKNYLKSSAPKLLFKKSPKKKKVNKFDEGINILPLTPPKKSKLKNPVMEDMELPKNVLLSLKLDDSPEVEKETIQITIESNEENKVPETTNTQPHPNKINNILKSFEKQLVKKYCKLAAAKIKMKGRKHMRKFKAICSKCKAVFMNINDYRKHLKNHSPTKISTKAKTTLSCPQCLLTFHSPYLLAQHQESHEELESDMLLPNSRLCECYCPFCTKKFFYVGARNRHILKHSSVYPNEVKTFLDDIRCGICQRLFVTKKKKMMHMQLKHKTKQDQLHITDSIKPSEVNVKAIDKPIKIKKNRIISTEETPVVSHAEVNDNQPASVQFVKKPSLSVSPSKKGETASKKKFTFMSYCKFCPKRFPNLKALENHLQMYHNEELTVQCTECSYRFPSDLDVVEHMNKRHKDVLKGKLLKQINNVEPKSPKLVIKSKNSTTPAKPKLIKSLDKVSAATKSKVIIKNNDKHIVESNSVIGTVNANTPLRKLSKSVDILTYIGGGHIHRIDDISGRGLYSCSLCQISTFTKMSAVRRHCRARLHRSNLSQLKRASNNTEFYNPNTSQLICSVCNQSFQGVAEFLPHRLNHFNTMDINYLYQGNIYKCEICCKQFDHQNRVQAHLLWHLRAAKTTNSPDLPEVSDEPSVSSPNSSKTFFTVSPKSESNQDAFLQIAKKSIGSPTQNVKNSETETNFVKKAFACENCSLSFTTKQHYTAHIRRYCRAEIPCIKCGMVFSSQRSYRVHKNRCYKNRFKITSNRLRCQYCSLDFSSRDDLGWHEKSCRKVNSSEGAIYQSSMVPDKIIKCKICHQSFMKSSVFKEHKKLCHENSLQPGLISSSKIGSPKLKGFGKKLKVVTNTRQKMLDDCSINGNPSSIQIASHRSPKRKFSKSHKCVCLLCKIKFSDQRSLKKHLVAHYQYSNDIRSNDHEHDDSFSESLKEIGSIDNQQEDQENSYITYRKEVDDDVPIQFPVRDKSEEPLKNGKIFDYPNQHKSSGRKDMLLKKLNSDNHSIEILKCLRKNFSQLLYLLVSDPELMEELGWGQKQIDIVLIDVLHHMGQSAFSEEADLNETECLRKNIQLLLHLCIKDDVMLKIQGRNKLVDEVVFDMLRMCKTTLDNQVTSK